MGLWYCKFNTAKRNQKLLPNSWILRPDLVCNQCNTLVRQTLFTHIIISQHTFSNAIFQERTHNKKNFVVVYTRPFKINCDVWVRIFFFQKEWASKGKNMCARIKITLCTFFSQRLQKEGVRWLKPHSWFWMALWENPTSFL